MFLLRAMMLIACKKRADYSASNYMNQLRVEVLNLTAKWESRFSVEVTMSHVWRTLCGMKSHI